MSKKPATSMSVGRLLALAHQQFSRELAKRLVADGWNDVTTAHGKALEAVAATGSRVQEMATSNNISHQAMTQLVDHLEAFGYVTRKPDPADARAKLVFPTQRAKKHLQDAWRHIELIEAEWEQTLGTRKLKDLRNCLSILNDQERA